jgi:hypothetical protein
MRGFHTEVHGQSLEVRYVPGSVVRLPEQAEYVVDLDKSIIRISEEGNEFDRAERLALAIIATQDALSVVPPPSCPLTPQPSGLGHALELLPFGPGDQPNVPLLGDVE